MKLRVSHRWRISIAAAAASAALFGLIFRIAYAQMAGMELKTEGSLLSAPLGEALGTLKAGEALDDEISRDERVTLVVTAGGRVIYRGGKAPVSGWTGSGERSAGGAQYLYRTAEYQGKSIVVATDWTLASRRLRSLRRLLLLLVFPLAGCVGLVAYVSAGVMYRSLHQLSLEAKDLSVDGRIRELTVPDDPDLSKLAEQLNALLRRIAAEVQRQERLVCDVAHDLRTPLTVIRGRLETAVLQARTDEYRGAMVTAIREAERLSEMADAILRSEERRLEVEPSELSALAGEAIARWRPIFGHRGARLDSKLVECRARISPEEWAGVLDNLLDNVYKYGGGACSVELRAADQVELVVSDDGPGVAPPDRERVFERFVRLDRTRGSAGHGLGLHLCKSIVEARHGSIRIEGEPGRMRVVVRLPAARA